MSLQVLIALVLHFALSFFFDYVVPRAHLSVCRGAEETFEAQRRNPCFYPCNFRCVKREAALLW